MRRIRSAIVVLKFGSFIAWRQARQLVDKILSSAATDSAKSIGWAARKNGRAIPNACKSQKGPLCNVTNEAENVTLGQTSGRLCEHGQEVDGNMHLRLIGLACTVAVASACPQTLPQAGFDVASIKPSRAAGAGGEGSGREKITVTPDSVIIQNAGLNFCIQSAYNVKFYQVSGPDWLVFERYDIIAKTERRSSKEQLMGMLQALLTDRFSLRLRRETRPLALPERVPG